MKAVYCKCKNTYSIDCKNKDDKNCKTQKKKNRKHTIGNKALEG